MSARGSGDAWRGADVSVLRSAWRGTRDHHESSSRTRLGRTSLVAVTTQSPSSSTPMHPRSAADALSSTARAFPQNCARVLHNSICASGRAPPAGSRRGEDGGQEAHEAAKSTFRGRGDGQPTGTRPQGRRLVPRCASHAEICATGTPRMLGDPAASPGRAPTGRDDGQFRCEPAPLGHRTCHP